MKLKCSCTHTEQDKLHGKNIRVANLTAAADHAKCTVCGKIHKVK